MDIPAGSIPPWKGLDCRCSSDPCFYYGSAAAAVAPIGCHRLHQRGSPELLHVLKALLAGWKSFQDVTKSSWMHTAWLLCTCNP